MVYGSLFFGWEEEWSRTACSNVACGTALERVPFNIGQGPDSVKQGALSG
jgi:hypothetical protein